jgi:hypothetical protein
MNALDVMEALVAIYGPLPYTTDHDEDGNFAFLSEHAAVAELDDILAALIVRALCPALPDDSQVTEEHLNDAIRAFEKTRRDLDAVIGALEGLRREVKSAAPPERANPTTTGRLGVAVNTRHGARRGHLASRI